jgi:hypothetical protein
MRSSIAIVLAVAILFGCADKTSPAVLLAPRSAESVVGEPTTNGTSDTTANVVGEPAPTTMKVLDSGAEPKSSLIHTFTNKTRLVEEVSSSRRERRFWRGVLPLHVHRHAPTQRRSYR